jgi:hypothetical protein
MDRRADIGQHGDFVLTQHELHSSFERAGRNPFLPHQQANQGRQEGRGCPRSCNEALIL